MFETGYYALGIHATPYYMRPDEGATVGLGYFAERRRRKRAHRDDADLIAIIMAFMEIKDD